jgi:Tol biopolymer transport system component
MDSDGSNLMPFFEIVGMKPYWSPDGESVVFCREGAIYVIDSDGSNEQLIADINDQNYARCWSWNL